MVSLRVEKYLTTPHPPRGKDVWTVGIFQIRFTVSETDSTMNGAAQPQLCGYGIEGFFS